MCRSIKRLRQGAAVVSVDEIEAAALQFVRKISGYRKPSKANAAAFEDAVREVTEASEADVGAAAGAGLRVGWEHLPTAPPLRGFPLSRE